MNGEQLSSHFKGIAWKRLSAVEADRGRSHQHELNGATGLKQLFGKAKKELNAQLLYLGDGEDDTIKNIAGTLTWYDARKKNSTGANRSEYRMYFKENLVSESAREGDLLIIGKRDETSVLAVIAKAGSTYERQVQWLFGIENTADNKFNVHEVTGQRNQNLDYVARLILEELGIETQPKAGIFLEIMLRKFGGGFPTTAVFSQFTRQTAERFDCKSAPDEALIGWMDHEERLFKTLEYHIVAKDLTKGFKNDVDGFIRYSLQVQNRRKARSGRALENHLEYIFEQNSVQFSKNGVTENNSKPDFVFPGIKQYRNSGFPAIKLSMLGVKTTCKDRWRQVLAEAARINEKHLFTLEPGISKNQTDQMKASSLQLVIPSSLFKTYTPPQQNQLMALKQFIELVKRRQ